MGLLQYYSQRAESGGVAFEHFPSHLAFSLPCHGLSEVLGQDKFVVLKKTQCLCP